MDNPNVRFFGGFLLRVGHDRLPGVDDGTVLEGELVRGAFVHLQGRLDDRSSSHCCTLLSLLSLCLVDRSSDVEMMAS